MNKEFLQFALKSRQDPAWFIRNVFDEKPWSKQVETIESVRDNPQTAVRSCHAAGKSYIASRTAMWFSIVHPGSVVITTAPSNRQVKNIIWKEIRSSFNRIEERFKDKGLQVGGRLLSQELKFDDDWFMLGFTAPEYDSDKFQGFHAEDILVILDEACGISNIIYEGIDGILTSTGSRRLEIGNPTDPNAAFAGSFKSKSETNKIKISVFETPNFTINGITESDIKNGDWAKKVKEIPYPTLATPAWAARIYKRHGENSQYYKSRVLAEFPDQGLDTLIPLSFIEKCQCAELSDEARHGTLGVDVARYGTNESVIYHMKGAKLRKFGSWNGLNTMGVAGKVIEAVRETGAYFVNVDVIGIGAGVVDRLIEILNEKQGGNPEYLTIPDFVVNGINVGSPSNFPDSYMNLKVEMWFNVRSLLEKGKVDLDPEDEDLAAELASLRYMTTSTGKVRMELKEDMIRRGETSPDHADSACLALIPCAMPPPNIESVAAADGVMVTESSVTDGFL